MDGDSLLPVLTLEQAASYLQLTVEELRTELESGSIPAWKVAGKWRVKREVLERLLESRQATAAPDPQQQTTEIVSSQTTQSATSQVQAAPSIPTSAPLQIPPSHTERVQGYVYAYNHKEGFGHARLPNNRVVWLDFKHLIQGEPKPYLGDTVEFELHRSRIGLEAHAIRIIAKDEASAQPAKASAITPDKDPWPEPPASVVVPRPSIARTPRASVPMNGTSQSQRLYQNAAVARAEGRIEEARRLFRQSIEAGGGTQVFEAFFKMELERGSRAEARRIIQQAIETFPDHANYYEMYGHMERRARNYQRAEEIFREGLLHAPRHVSLRWGLGQTLVQIGTENSFREAGQIFEALAKEGRLHKRDGLYQRFEALQRSPRANQAFDFFQQIGDIRVGIAGRRDLPRHITDIVVETNNQQLSESFGLSGASLVRCFQRVPPQIEIVELSKYLRSLGPQDVLGLQGGREVVLNSSLAFIAVPSSDAVRDQVMSVLSDSNEAIVPLDDALFHNSEESLKTLCDLLGQYLGSRDLYSSTLPVSGRRFFGRERLLLQLTDEVQRGQFLGIYGLRKMGKTSLLYQFRDEKLRGEAVAYVDLEASSALPTKNCAPLYWELERDLYLRLHEQRREAADLLRLGKVERFSDLPEPGVRAALLFAEDLRAFLDAIRAGRIPGIQRLVIVLDEVERILPVAGQGGIDGYVEFFGLLRGLAQTERYRSLLSSVVVAANAAISERGYWEGRENPVFALYKPVFLLPLSELECAEMIRSLGKGMSVYWDDDAIFAVFVETGGHPFLTRVFCSRIAKQHLTRPLKVTAAMVQEQIGAFIRDESDKLEQITELLRTNFPQEEIFLQQIALEEAPDEIPDEALRHLLGYHLIVTEGNGYRVTLNLLRRWLRRRAGIRE